MFSELYFWLYDFLNKVKSNDNPKFNAFIGISFFQCMNVLILFGVAHYFLAFDISKNLAAFMGILIYVTITAVNFFSIFRKKDELIKRYEKLTIERKNKGKLLFWLYAFITLGLFIYVILNLVAPI